MPRDWAELVNEKNRKAKRNIKFKSTIKISFLLALCIFIGVKKS